MEEVYIIKLKGLPNSSNQQQSVRGKDCHSFYYTKDLTAEALMGFGLIQAVLGLILIVLAIVHLLTLEVLVTPQVGVGIWSGAIFVITGLSGVLAAAKRKRDISRSKLQVRLFFIMALLSLLVSFGYLIMLIVAAFGTAADPLASYQTTTKLFLSGNIIITFVIEASIALLSLFTTVRVIWPGSFGCLAKDWPGRPKLKKKVIVSTKIYATTMGKEGEDFCRNLGPNCVISLSNPPKPNTETAISNNAEGTSEASLQKHYNRFRRSLNRLGRSKFPMNNLNKHSNNNNNNSDPEQIRNSAKSQIEGIYSNGDAISGGRSSESTTSGSDSGYHPCELHSVPSPTSVPSSSLSCDNHLHCFSSSASSTSSSIDESSGDSGHYNVSSSFVKDSTPCGREQSLNAQTILKNNSNNASRVIVNGCSTFISEGTVNVINLVGDDDGHYDVIDDDSFDEDDVDVVYDDSTSYS